jgi:hypothetical protein
MLNQINKVTGANDMMILKYTFNIYEDSSRISERNRPGGHLDAPRAIFAFNQKKRLSPTPQALTPHPESLRLRAVVPWNDSWTKSAPSPLIFTRTFVAEENMPC